MGSEAEKEYAAFQEKVKRSVYLDNLSPQVTEAVIKTALNQYGNVIRICFIPQYTDSSSAARCAVVELETKKQATTIIEMLAAYPFMMSGMPRPVRARAAEEGMFEDRPVKPGRKIKISWLDPKESDFQVAQKLKNMAKRHFSEISFLHKNQLEQEEKLSKQQAEVLKANHQKYEIIDGVTTNGVSKRLARRYGMNLNDDTGF